ncbi:MAG: DUF554 domain-containing protein [Chitinispirillia bacterium]|nr:DUF554 domain-containing protein [Chitinispirillia bacterium]MCL2269599.1 DUF554 domain-containing protein [Chitinispirillia bacterium]
MTALWGTTVNAAAIILGCLAGLLLPRMPEKMRGVIMQGLGLAILFLGISMGIKTGNFIIVVVSLVAGGVLGSLLKLDDLLQGVGDRLGSMVKRGPGNVAEGFVTATLIFCVGAMAVLGAVDSGLRGDHTMLYIKSLLDGITAMVLATTLGFGVAFSGAAVFIYQGAVALSAGWITSFLGEEALEAVITEVSAVGGVLIAGIGINVLGISKINVVNLLPAIFVAAGLVLARGYWVP